PEFAAVNPELNARVLEHKLHRNWMTGPRDCFHVDLLSVWFARRLPEQNRNETAAFRNGAMRDWGGGAPRDCVGWSGTGKSRRRRVPSPGFESTSTVAWWSLRMP